MSSTHTTIRALVPGIYVDGEQVPVGETATVPTAVAEGMAAHKAEIVGGAKARKSTEAVMPSEASAPKGELVGNVASKDGATPVTNAKQAKSAK